MNFAMLMAVIYSILSSIGLGGYDITFLVALVIIGLIIIILIKLFLVLIPAIIIDIISADPAYPATMPITTKIPPPMIAPTLMATALHKPIERFSFLGS